MSVRDIDHGFAEAIKSYTKDAPLSVAVGILGDAGSDLIDIAAVQEFGSDDGKIPERSYLRSTADEQRTELLDKFTRLLKVDRPQIAIQKFGMLVVSAVREKIRSRQTRGPKPQENKPATAKAKGSDVPLIDTGRLIQSIKAEQR